METTAAKGKHRSETERRHYAHAWHASGLSQEAFAKQEGLCSKSLNRWVKKYLPDNQSKQAAPKLLPAKLSATVPVSCTQAKASSLDILLPSGIRLRTKDTAQAVTLIRALEQ